MNAKDFCDAVKEHPQLEWIGVNANPPEVFVRQKTTDKDVDRAIGLRSVWGNTWEVLEPVLTGKANPQVMYHYSRVVGYFSRVDNWDKGKVAELKDRQEGDYAVSKLKAPQLEPV